MKTTGRRRTPARFIASCASPRAAAPSPNQPTATRFSSRIRKASAQPTATGSIAGRWLTIAISPRRASAMWTLPSLPRVGPSARPMYWAKIRHGSTPRDDVDAHVAVERRADVVGPHRRRDADRGALVAAAGVERAGDLALLVEDVAALLDPARDQHVAVDAEQVLAVEARLPDLAQRADRLGFAYSHAHPWSWAVDACTLTGAVGLRGRFGHELLEAGAHALEHVGAAVEPERRGDFLRVGEADLRPLERRPRRARGAAAPSPRPRPGSAASRPAGRRRGSARRPGSSSPTARAPAPWSMRAYTLMPRASATAARRSTVSAMP